MSYTLLSLSLFIAIIDWFAVVKGWKNIEYIAKPAVMLALLVWLGSVGGFHGPMTWFTLGLAASLAGDIFLMLPREQFIPGLVAFLLAHLSYLIGFNATLPPLNLASLAILLIVGVTTARLYGTLSSGLESSGQSKLKGPVLAYSIVISLMLVSALLTLVRPEWTEGSAWLASAGALLFFLSDSLLAWNKFVQPIRHGRLAVMVTYHLGQILITLAAATHFLK